MITVVMTTYAPIHAPERARYVDRSLYSLACNLKAPTQLRLHIADDGSHDTQYITDWLKCMQNNWHTVSTVSYSQHRGIGASLNLAMPYVDDYWMYTTDDWVLTNELDLTHAIGLLNSGYDVVRLGPIHPFLWCLTQYTELGWHLDIDTKWRYAWATRPFIASESLIAKIGLFDEGRNVYDTETLYSDRITRHGGIKIAYDGNLSLLGPWQHIGEIGVGYDK